MTPRVSVITSIYKASEFLSGFLTDARRQSIFFDCEFLLLDANEDSKDFELIIPFLDIPNFKYVKIGKTSIYEAWNIGVNKASSNLLTNWNVDDRREIFSLEKQVSILESDLSIDVCFGPTLFSTIPNEVFEYSAANTVFPALDITLENLLQHNSPHCLPVWRKSLHDKFGAFDTKYRSAADYDFWLRAFCGGAKFQKIDDIIGLYYYNPSGISTDPATRHLVSLEEAKIKSKYQ